MKGYTTIEQSKKLIKLGIDVDTADMFYGYTAPYEHSDCMYDGGYDEIPYPKDFLKLNANFSESDYDGKLPCWSTEALLDILDETIVTDEGEEYILQFGKDGTSYYMYYKDAYRSMNNRIEELDFSCSTLLKCAFEMIVKLKELKLI